MALGAQPGDVLRLVVREGLRLALLVALIGGIGSIAAARWVASDLYGIKAWDPFTLAGVAAIAAERRIARLLHSGAPRHARRSYASIEVRMSSTIRDPGRPRTESNLSGKQIDYVSYSK